MRILLKCPTRSRPQKVVAMLRAYVKNASDPSRIGVALSCDEDDSSMSQPSVQREIHDILTPFSWHRVFFSPNNSKIQACNANMNEIDYPWDIVVLVSDDMLPKVTGWDSVIRTHMQAYFPTTDGILWCNDGFQGDKLNTLCVYGRKMYERFGYIYHPAYKSLFCDTELTDRCRGDLADKCRYIPYCIIRHEHPGTGYAQNMDLLYAKNQTYWIEDMHTYINRKSYPYDWSILIPTIPGREASLTHLIGSIQEKLARLAPELRFEFCVSFDNREMSIGMKRQNLLQGAKGKYTSFIDDDDDITDAYIEDLRECVKGGHHTMRLRGQMAGYPFVHSTEITLTSPMATQDTPPVFQRPPNHLNPMLTDVAKLIPFKDAIRGEDLDWTLRLYKSKFLQSEYRSDPTRVHYIYNLGPRTIHPETARLQTLVSYETMLQMIFIPSGAVEPPTTPGPRVLRLGAKGFVSK